MKKLTLVLVSTVLLFISGCGEPEVIYVDRTFPRIPEYKITKRTFTPLIIDYEAIK